MVNYFDGDAPGDRFSERSRDIAVERGPGFLIDLGFERGFERFVGIVGP